MPYIRYNDIFEPVLADKIHKDLAFSSRWSFTGTTDNKSSSDILKFWYNDLNKVSLYTKYFFSKIQNITCKSFLLKTVYANGQTYGLNSHWHVDSNEENDYTFLYYVNHYWNPLWGGNTLFTYQDKIHTSEFIPNSAILFKSNIPHIGMEPTRSCRELRITVAFKLTEI